MNKAVWKDMIFRLMEEGDIDVTITSLREMPGRLEAEIEFSCHNRNLVDYWGVVELKQIHPVEGQATVIFLAEENEQHVTFHELGMVWVKVASSHDELLSYNDGDPFRDWEKIGHKLARETLRRIVLHQAAAGTDREKR